MEAAAMQARFTTRHLIAAALLVAATVAITFAAWADMARLAMKDEESTHILLVPLVVAWLVWVRRQRLRHCRPTGRWIGTVIMLLGWGAWSYGYRFQRPMLWIGGAVALAVGALLSVLGRDLLFNFMPAFAALIFLVPVAGERRQQIAQPLQTATATVTQHVSETLGFKVARDANLLSVNGTPVAIAEACNGMRMVITLFLVCYLMAFITPLHAYVRVLLLLLSPLVAVIANVVRLVPTVYMFGVTTEERALQFHDAAGWVMLFVAFFALNGVIGVLKWAKLPVAPYSLAGGA